MITTMNECLKNESIVEHLDTEAYKLFNNHILMYETIDSTNIEAKRLVKDNAVPSHGVVLLAESQTAGRGRLGRSFYSPKSSGIYTSIIFDSKELKKGASTSLAVTVAAAIAVRRALEEVGVEAKIKWVNDLFVENKKVCGILTEGIFATGQSQLATGVETYVIGIGINVFDAEDGFPQELKHIAGALNKAIDRNILVAKLLNNLLSVLAEEDTSVIDEYRKYSLVLNKEVTVIKPSETYLAVVREITDEAHLVVELKDGKREELLSGEVSLRLT